MAAFACTICCCRRCGDFAVGGPPAGARAAGVSVRVAAAAGAGPFPDGTRRDDGAGSQARANRADSGHRYGGVYDVQGRAGGGRLKAVEKTESLAEKGAADHRVYRCAGFGADAAKIR